MTRPCASTATRRVAGRSRPAVAGHGPGGDRGAAAVEFALLLPVLLLIVFGLIDFGRALNAQITLTQAAREGARLDALGQSAQAVVQRTITAATGLGLTAGDVTETQACAPGAGPSADADVQVSYRFTFITPVAAISTLFGASAIGGPVTMTARGVMPCET